MINFLQGLTSAEFQERAIRELQQLYIGKENTYFGAAILALIAALQKYATMTPARLAFEYAFSNLEQDAANLVTKVYLAVIELRNPQIKVTFAELEDIQVIALGLVKKAPSIYMAFKEYSKKYPSFDDEEKQLEQNDIIIADYYREFKAGLPTTVDPFTLNAIRILANHKLLNKYNGQYDFDELTYNLLMIMLKLDAKVDMQSFLNCIFVSGNPNLGQFHKYFIKLANEIWPKTLKETFAESSIMCSTAFKLLLRNDVSIIQDIYYISTRHQVDFSDKYESNITLLAGDVASCIKLLQGIMLIQIPELQEQLLNMLATTLKNNFASNQEQNITPIFFEQIRQNLDNSEVRNQCEVFLNKLASQNPETLLFAVNRSTEARAPTSPRQKLIQART
jgi:hypothetical protein